MIQSVEIMEGKFSLRHEMVLNAISLIIIESEENYLKYRESQLKLFFLNLMFLLHCMIKFQDLVHIY